jgi:hypothetical protein
MPKTHIDQIKDLRTKNMVLELSTHMTHLPHALDSALKEILLLAIELYNADRYSLPAPSLRKQMITALHHADDQKILDHHARLHTFIHYIHQIEHTLNDVAKKLKVLRDTSEGKYASKELQIKYNDMIQDIQEKRNYALQMLAMIEEDLQKAKPSLNPVHSKTSVPFFNPHNTKKNLSTHKKDPSAPSTSKRKNK